MELNWEELKGKKAHIILNNNYEYNCTIDNIDKMPDGKVFIQITDKFGAMKMFTSSEIKFLEVKE